MREVLTGLAERRLGEVVEARLAEEPVVVLNGPRTVGKSTLLSELAGRLGRAVVDCDDLAAREAVRSDPARFVESDQPVLIDEYQHVPELLDAIKAQLNRDLRPGRYILAGSTRYATLPEAAQALTGRVDIIPVLPLSQGEIGDVRETFVARLLDGAGIDMTPSQMSTPRDEYALRATSGGMPVALRRPPGRSRSRWFSNGCGSSEVSWLRCEDESVAVSGAVDAFVLAAEVEAPVVLEVAAGDQGAEFQDGLGAF